MQNRSSGKDKTPQIFFNSNYFGDLEKLNREKNESATKLLETIKSTLNEEPGDLYQIYKKQTEIFLIQPSDFHFPLPLNRTMICAVNLINQTDSYAAFKLKTTAPKRYTVKPKDGIVAPRQVQKIEVTLHQDVIEIPEDDKFRLESVRILNSSSITEKTAVNDSFNLYQKSIVKQKICCVFGITPPNMKIMQYSDHIYIEPFESEESKYNEEDESEIERYDSFTAATAASISPKKSISVDEVKLDESKKSNLEQLKKLEEEEKEKERLEELKEKERLEGMKGSVEEMTKEKQQQQQQQQEKQLPNIEGNKKQVVSPTIEKEQRSTNDDENGSKTEQENTFPKKIDVNTKKNELSSMDVTTPSPLDLPKINSSWGILEKDYFSPKKKNTTQLDMEMNENFNEVKLHKTSKISILLEENQQLKKEIEKYKNEIEKFQKSEKKGNKEDNMKNEEEKYSLLMVVFIAMLFYLVGKLL